MKKFDKVRYSEKGKWKFSGIIFDIVGEYALVETFIYGQYKIKIALLEPMPEAKGLIQVKGRIPEKQMRELRAQWDAQLDKSQSFRCPILEE